MALWRILHDAASRHPYEIAVSAGGRDYTYAAINDLVERVAAGLRFQGLAPDDRVVTILGNTISHLGLILGCFRAGLVAVPMAPTTAPAIVRYTVRTSGARGIAAATTTLDTITKGHDELRTDVMVAVGDSNPPHGMIPWEVIEAGPGDPPPFPGRYGDHLGLILFTSGTTSRPKAVTHTQHRMARRSACLAEQLGLTKEDVAFVTLAVGRPLPLLSQVLGTFSVGGRVVLHEGGVNGFWQAYSTGPPKSFVVTIPAMLPVLFAGRDAAAADHSALRVWLAGGDSVPADMHTRFRKIIDKPIVEICGMTEAGFYSVNPIGSVRVGSIGRPLPGVTVRLVGSDGDDVAPGEAGEIVLRSPDMMAGYWNDTAETFRVLRDGWLHTGDLARADADGFLWFTGRAKDLICRGGRKVAPPMVEEALASHPAVARAVVVGAPDTSVGQVPFAFLMLRPEAKRPADTELVEWLSDKLDPDSIPVAFELMNEWPLTDQGKIDRARLVWMAANCGVAL